MSKEDSAVDLAGRKIFFLNPLPSIRNIVIDELIQREYETYAVNDRVILRRLLRDFPGSVIFIDIDQIIGEKEWEAWIREVTKAGDLTDIRIGILTANRNDALQNKYANMLRLPCGYTMIHRDLNITIAQIVNILNVNNAKGRRKYLRASIENESQTVVNFPQGSQFVSGVIRDISTAGFSCSFTEDPNFPKNSSFSNVQIKLKHTILNVEAVIFGFRAEKKDRVYVSLFTDRISPDSKVKIRKYIQGSLQARMDALMGQN
ncbi:MAG: PilZ domain-containing protein [Treponema sp.]|jgi:hypothetical protein|nr:PilZ domain-containing protein [Treponema sp.]